MATLGTDILSSAVATPPSGKPGLRDFQKNQAVMDWGARAGAWFAATWGATIRTPLGILVAGHADVRDVLARDLEFRIAPVNEARIKAVNGPFVLGMDRGTPLPHERALLYAALSTVDMASLRARVTAMAEERVAAAGATIDVVAGYARPIAAATATALFGIPVADEPLFMDVARAVFNHIFLNLADDKDVEARALKAATLMRQWLADEIARRRHAADLGTDMMGALLQGTADDDLVRRTLGGMFVGSVDTTASSVAKILVMIGKDPKLAGLISAAADDEAQVAGFCWEALRRWPHNPILLREAVIDTTIGGVAVKAREQVVLWTQAAMLDASVFPDPLQMNPSRPEKYYLHFGGGLHPCAGRVVNAFQIPLLVGALVRRGIARVGPVQWAGPFPDHLSLEFTRGRR